MVLCIGNYAFIKHEDNIYKPSRRTIYNAQGLDEQ